MAEAPAILKRPITVEGKERAVEEKSALIFRKFYSEAMRHRSWNPFDLPFREMRELGGRLSDDAVTILEGFLGVEAYIDDYMRAGFEGYKGHRVYLEVLQQWGDEEWRHPNTIAQSLIYSGKRTPQQINEYYEKLAENPWSPAQHHILSGPAAALIFSGVQERETFVDYKGARRIVRADYGLPEHRTPEEYHLGREIGVSQALSLNGGDEIEHHVLFRDLILVRLEYFPDETTQTIYEVLEGFGMPAVTLLPNRRAFLHVIRKTGIASKEIQQAQVFQPFLKAVGMAA